MRWMPQHRCTEQAWHGSCTTRFFQVLQTPALRRDVSEGSSFMQDQFGQLRTCYIPAPSGRPPGRPLLKQTSRHGRDHRTTSPSVCPRHALSYVPRVHPGLGKEHHGLRRPSSSAKRPLLARSNLDRSALPSVLCRRGYLSTGCIRPRRSAGPVCAISSCPVMRNSTACAHSPVLACAGSASDVSSDPRAQRHAYKVVGYIGKMQCKTDRVHEHNGFGALFKQLMLDHIRCNRGPIAWTIVRSVSTA